jgi:hypothetical protein
VVVINNELIEFMDVEKLPGEVMTKLYMFNMLDEGEVEEPEDHKVIRDIEIRGTCSAGFHGTDEVYNGDIKGGKINGESLIFFDNGVIFEGELRDGKINGFGRYAFNPRESYVRYFENNMPHGNGCYSNGNEEFNGIWEYGVFKG